MRFKSGLQQTLEHFYCTLQGFFSLLERACFDHWPLPKYSDITMMDTELRVFHQFQGLMLIPFMPFHKGHADSSLSTLSAHAQPSLSGMGSFISLGLSFCSFSETMLTATKMLKHLHCTWMKIKMQFLFWKIRFLWFFFFFTKHTETQGEVFQFSVQNLSLKKNPSMFLRVAAGMLTLGKVPATSSFFPTMLPEVARSRIRQSCVSKRNGCSEPHLLRSPCAAALPGTARDNKKAFQLENKQKN